MLKNISNLGKNLSKIEQRAVTGGIGSVFICEAHTEGYTCFSPTTGTDGVGICQDGVCYDC